MVLDESTLLLAYDRLAHGWLGPPGQGEPPGPLGDKDRVFTMQVKVVGGV